MTRQVVFWLIWVAFVGYAFVLAPPDQPDTFTLIQSLATGQVVGVNPAIVALFNLMGVWPALYAALLFIDGRNQSFWAWPFVLGSFAFGAFALLPYLALRRPAPEFSGTKNWWLAIQDSRWLGGVLAIAAISLLVYGVTQGNWPDFVNQWQTNRFIHVMSLDFCMLALLFPTLLGDDMARRGLNQSTVFWIVSLLPLIGPAFYLVLRPPIQQ